MFLSLHFYSVRRIGHRHRSNNKSSANRLLGMTRLTFCRGRRIWGASCEPFAMQPSRSLWPLREIIKHSAKPTYASKAMHEISVISFISFILLTKNVSSVFF